MIVPFFTDLKRSDLERSNTPARPLVFVLKCTISQHLIQDLTGGQGAVDWSGVEWSGGVRSSEQVPRLRGLSDRYAHRRTRRHCVRVCLTRPPAHVKHADS